MRVPDTMTFKEFEALLRKDHPERVKSGTIKRLMSLVMYPQSYEDDWPIEYIRVNFMQTYPFENSTRRMYRQIPMIGKVTYDRLVQIIEEYDLAK